MMRRHWGQGRGERRLVKPWGEPDTRRIPPTSEVSGKTAKLKPLELIVKVRWHHKPRHLVAARQVLLHLQQVLLLIHGQLGVVGPQLGIIGEQETVLELRERKVRTPDIRCDRDCACMCCMRLQAELVGCLQTEQVSTMGSVLVVLVWASLAARPSSVSSSSGWARPEPLTLGEPTLASASSVSPSLFI